MIEIESGLSERIELDTGFVKVIVEVVFMEDFMILEVSGYRCSNVVLVFLSCQSYSITEQ